MHYSVIPYESVFADNSDTNNKACVGAVYKGVKMDVSPTDDGYFKIERIYSSNPQDFLNSGLQIGKKIILPPG